MGFWGAVAGALSSGISAVCSVVSSCAATIGGAIAKVATGIMIPLAKLTIEGVLKAVEIIGAVIGAIAEALGLKKEEETPEEIGMKAEEAAKEGIKPENFDSYEEYINYIRENIEIDKAKLENLSKEDKIKYTAIGSSILVKGIEEKEKYEIPGEFVAEIGRQNLSVEETREYIKTFKSEDLKLKDFVNFLAGTIDIKTYTTVGNAIESAIKNLNPDMTDREIDDKITNMKANVRM